MDGEFMDENLLKEEYEKYGLRYYTPNEELWNAITHGIGAPIALAFMIYLLVIASSIKEIFASLLLCLPAIQVYTGSGVYHALKDFKKKSLARRIDHANIAFLVTACGVPFALLFNDYIINYVGVGLCFALAITNACLCIYDLMRFKVFGVVVDSVIGGILLIIYIININSPYATLEVNLLFLIGFIFCVAGLILYAVKKKYIHTVFHVATLIGPILMMVGAVVLFNIN